MLDTPDKPAPLSVAEYTQLLLYRQCVHPGTRHQGKSGLRSVLSSLEGYATYPLLWQRDILPSRVSDFDPQWLCELVDDGELVFGRICRTGEPNNTPGGGTVFCRPESLRHLLIEHEPPDYYWGTAYSNLQGEYEDCLAVYAAARRSGPATLRELASGVGLSEARTEIALWHLYTGGSLTNTSALCLLHSTLTSFLVGGGDEETRRGRLRKYGLRADEGAWVSCVQLRPDLSGRPDPEEAERRRVARALQTFGAAPVPVLTTYLSGRFAQQSGKGKRLQPSRIRAICDDLVAGGDAAKGHFVRDLPGEQYAVPDMELTVPGTAQTRDMLCVSSLDPASVYIDCYPVPSLNAYCFPGRHVVLDRGHLVAVVDQKTGGRHRFTARSLHLPSGIDADGLSGVIDALADYLMRSGCYDELEILGFSGPATNSDALEEVLLSRGFRTEGKGLRVALSDLTPPDGGFLPQLGSDLEEEDDLAAIQVVFEEVAQRPLQRQRAQGRTTLKLKGRLVVNWVDGQDPVLVSTSVTGGQEALYRAIPDTLRPKAIYREDRWANHVEVAVDASVDTSGGAFRRLLEAWVESALNRARRRRARKSPGDK